MFIDWMKRRQEYLEQLLAEKQAKYKETEQAISQIETEYLQSQKTDTAEEPPTSEVQPVIEEQSKVPVIEEQPKVNESAVTGEKENANSEVAEDTNSTAHKAAVETEEETPKRRTRRKKTPEHTSAEEETQDESEKPTSPTEGSANETVVQNATDVDGGSA